MNWRKPLINLMLRATGSQIPETLKEMRNLEFAGREQIEDLQSRKLEKLLLHAWRNVAYYREILGDSGVVKDGEVRLDNFEQMPLLTKEIIQREGENLYSSDYQTRKPYENTSGGSTGAPARFIQDQEYDDWNIATKLYFNMVLGKQPGEPEIKFWGSDRDILEGSLTVRDRVINWLYNRRFFNSYELGDKEIHDLIALNNRFKPKAYWSYMESALELADFVSKHGIAFYPPEMIISTIGPLTEEVRAKIEQGLNCKVYNQYGSREVGAVACECEHQNGLHMFPWWNCVELLNERGQPISDGEGNVVVTTLHNFSMPLIRYEIGDVAIAGGYECACGRNTFKLKTVLGRTLGYFRKSDGSLAHSHFLVQSLFFRDWIKRFQIVQETSDRVIMRIELSPGKEPEESDTAEIISKTKLFLGDSCEVIFDYVDEIERSSSGKYLYTICKV